MLAAICVLLLDVAHAFLEALWLFLPKRWLCTTAASRTFQRFDSTNLTCRNHRASSSLSTKPSYISNPYDTLATAAENRAILSLLFHLNQEFLTLTRNPTS
ncbi:hypothetical protein MLD38_005310 [Melastoma candidum]|uniref:Uncharacterized protein n=2 Tax=Melastoma candidum TaxID=119954 RepID=A0ACB9S9Q4_9MYRT|nr:hypothetical protein MLD38_005291 [Melastoma candidum]KAI4387482.1 hypothetical protein MLD38_005310 [Melastoma candidum]